MKRSTTKLCALVCWCCALASGQILKQAEGAAWALPTTAAQTRAMSSGHFPAPDTVEVAEDQVWRVAAFRNATALSLAPDGSAFVVDGGTGGIFRVGWTGATPVTEPFPAEVSAPHGVDASSGLEILVTSLQDGSVSILGREGSLRLRIGVGGPGNRQPSQEASVRAGSQGVLWGEGAVTDVVALRDGGFAVLELRRQGVLYYDRAGRLTRVLGSEDGLPEGPTRLVGFGDGLAVAGSREGMVDVVLLDAFGSVLNRLAIRADEWAMGGAPTGLWVAKGSELTFFGLDGMARHHVRLPKWPGGWREIRDIGMRLDGSDLSGASAGSPLFVLLGQELLAVTLSTR